VGAKCLHLIPIMATPHLLLYYFYIKIIVVLTCSGGLREKVSYRLTPHSLLFYSRNPNITYEMIEMLSFYVLLTKEIWILYFEKNYIVTIPIIVNS